MLTDTAEEYVLFPENIGTHLSIDETCLSHEELYTIVTNKAIRGKKGSLVAMVKGTKAEVVIDVLRKISAGKRSLVKEVTLDLSPSMQLIVRRCFPCAIQVSDRFHVQKLLGEVRSAGHAAGKGQPAAQSKLRELRQRARSACFVPLLSMKTPVFVDRQYQNQLLSMKSWVLVDRI